MSFLVASIPYAIIAIAWGVFMVKVSILKWRWDVPPVHIRVLVGALWPIWVTAILLCAVLMKGTPEEK